MTYAVDGQITTWKKNYAALAALQHFDLGYDNADQLTTAPLKNASQRVDRIVHPRLRYGE